MSEGAEPRPGALAIDVSAWTPAQRRLYGRVEDASLNASAPPQQRWMDGWMLRFSPGKAQRARCVHALSPSVASLDEQLAAAQALYDSVALPLLFRITPFTQPPTLDATLAARGWRPHDDTRVMVLAGLRDGVANEPPVNEPPVNIRLVDGEAFADAVGSLRTSPPAQRRAHAERLAASPIPFTAFVLEAPGDGVLACGQLGIEGSLAGFYDIVTHEAHRRKGLASKLCEHMLSVLKAMPNIEAAYLQVDAQNHAARRIYTRLGFVDAYGYHYRVGPSRCAQAVIAA